VIGLPLWSDLVAEFGWKQLSRARRRASPRLPDVRETSCLAGGRPTRPPAIWVTFSSSKRDG